MTSKHTRRAFLSGAGATAVSGAVGCRRDVAPSRPEPSRTPTPKPRPTLPGGGRSIGSRRLVGYVGLPDANTLGRLGTGDLDQRMREIRRRYAEAYSTPDRRTLPVAELITVVVQGSPGKDGQYRSVVSEDVIDEHLRAVRRHGALLLLDIQPGHSDFLSEISELERWITEPDVGVALDPEWAMDEGDTPGGTFGHTTGAELDEVEAYLSSVVGKHDLPEKPMVVHELAPNIVRDEASWRSHSGVVSYKSVDGIGARADKESTWAKVIADTPDHVRAGFKLFFDEDAERGPLMTPEQVLALTPTPDYVMYE